VVETARELNNCAAARKFGVTEKMVRDSRKNEDILKKMPRKKCATRTGITRWPELENYIAEWVLEQRQSGYIITRNMIRAHALKWSKLNQE